jgi:hypothetical protein
VGNRLISCEEAKAAIPIRDGRFDFFSIDCLERRNKKPDTQRCPYDDIE